MRRELGGAVVLSVALLGCGGNVVVDHGGEGGAMTSTPASTGTGDSCEDLRKDLAAKIAAARACDPALDVIQCDASTFVTDACACELPANVQRPEDVKAANEAHQRVVDAGCIAPCPAMQCPPNGNPQCLSGVCASQLGD